MPTHSCKKNIKINHISKIIINRLYIDSISGLIGLLSSLNLSGRTQDIHIYSRQGIEKYLDLAKKYSQTNFKYSIYVHELKTGLTIKDYNYKLYTYINESKLIFSFVTREQHGQFQLRKARSFYLTEGPLYGKLKTDNYFILPDGTLIKGNNFKNRNLVGNKISFIADKYHSRDQIEICYKNRQIYDSLK